MLGTVFPILGTVFLMLGTVFLKIGTIFPGTLKWEFKKTQTDLSETNI